MNDLIEVYDNNQEGYHKLYNDESIRVAILNYADRFDNIARLERHVETDETFVLLKGRATLLIGLECEKIKMKKYKVYRVKRNTWHNIRVSKNVKVLISENDSTGPDNTDYIDIV